MGKLFQNLRKGYNIPVIIDTVLIHKPMSYLTYDYITKPYNLTILLLRKRICIKTCLK